MSETSEPATQPVAPVATSSATETVVVAQEPKSNRVVQAAAWVGIVAGVVFIVAVVFFSGFILGKQSGPRIPNFEGPRPHHEMVFRDGPPGPPMMRPGQGMEGPGPGNIGPGPVSPPPSPPQRP